MLTNCICSFNIYGVTTSVSTSGNWQQTACVNQPNDAYYISHAILIFSYQRPLSYICFNASIISDNGHVTFRDTTLRANFIKRRVTVSVMGRSLGFQLKNNSGLKTKK